ncbi:MAG: sulfotransferase family protein, partial [Bacteroidales bacterium]
YIAENLPSMARIPFLLDLFPEARFIYIERNPYEVLASTFRFFKAFLVTLQLQDFDDESLWEFILHNYQFLFQRYQEDKNLIHDGHLVEIKYEQLVRDPEKILNQLLDGIFHDLEPDRTKLDPVLERHENHTLKKYEFDRIFIERVNHEIGDLIRAQGYQLL